MFRGTELVVAGKLKNGSFDEINTKRPEFNSSLVADSMDGNFEGSSIVTCFDFPIIPPVPVPQKRQIGDD